MKDYKGVEEEFHLFLTWALDGGECSASPPKEGVPISLEFDAGWAPGPISTYLRREKYLAPTANRTIHSLVARHNLKNRGRYI
jgi:hypothetical protein